MIVHCTYDAMVALEDIKPHPQNPNHHTDRQIERLAEILTYQGFRSPLLVSTLSGYLVAGHGRLLAAKKMGLKEVPVNHQDFKNEEQEYAHLVADNAIAEWAELDLSSINLAVPDLGPDFDINLLGLKDFEIEGADKYADKDADEIPDFKETSIILGDLFALGPHRLLCGDSTDKSSVERLMNGEKADMVFTDPPYNTGMSPKSNAGSTWLSHMFNDDFTDQDWNHLLEEFPKRYCESMKNDSIAYICLDWRRSHELVPHLKKNFKFSNLIVWDKMVHGLGSDYKYTHEFIHICKKGSPSLDTHKGDAEYQDIWHIQRKMGKDEDHATKKPIELITRALSHASKTGDLVLDFFLGSGSTLIACEKTNRKCFGMEIDPQYCQVIIDRWEKFTGQKAVKL